MTIMHNDLKEFHRTMLDAQRRKGFDLTVRDLMDAWKLRSTSAVTYRLKVLKDEGFVTTLNTGGKYHVYRALELD